MEFESAAVNLLKAPANRELQDLAALEKKIVQVRVAALLGSVIEKPDNPDDSEARTPPFRRSRIALSVVGRMGAMRLLIVCTHMCTVGP
jgi:hypothetical protein